MSGLHRTPLTTSQKIQCASMAGMQGIVRNNPCLLRSTSSI